MAKPLYIMNGMYMIFILLFFNLLHSDRPWAGNIAMS